MRRPPRHSFPWGYVCLALGAGILLAVIFPAGLLVFLMAAVLLLIGYCMIC